MTLGWHCGMLAQPRASHVSGNVAHGRLYQSVFAGPFGALRSESISGLLVSFAAGGRTMFGGGQARRRRLRPATAGLARCRRTVSGTRDAANAAKVGNGRAFDPFVHRRSAPEDVHACARTPDKRHFRSTPGTRRPALGRRSGGPEPPLTVSHAVAGTSPAPAW